MTAASSRLLGIAAGVAAGVIVGAVFLWFALRGHSIVALIGMLRRGDWTWPALQGMGGTVFFLLAKTIRWLRLLGAGTDLRFGLLLRAVVVGLGLNALIPHSGEFVRAAAMDRQVGRAATGVLASIFAERLFDICSVLLLVALALIRLPVPPSLGAFTGLLVIVAVGLVLALGVVVIWPRAAQSLVNTVADRLPATAGCWLRSRVAEAIDGLMPIRSLRTCLQVFGWSLLQWLAVAFCVRGCGAVVGVDVGMPGSILVVLGIVVAFLLPNAPGYTGSVQLAFLATLVPLGASHDRALAASIVYQLLMILPVIVVGLACLPSTLARRAARSVG